ncbi:MAG TPA: CBS domain-containing protein [Chthoniobacteraceae bacterium]|nr:CBS domain-containing protein [Chthoniobacteraceae bacterium]
MENDSTIELLLADKGSQTWSVAPTATVFEAIKLMAEKNVGALLVMEGSKLLGVISERDYTRKVILKGKSSRETPVADILSKDPVVISPHDKVLDGMRLMTQKRVRHLPVVEEGKVMGVVSIGDLVNWVISTQSATIDQLQKYIGLT